jgi:hypothetical protein
MSGGHGGRKSCRWWFKSSRPCAFRNVVLERGAARSLRAPATRAPAGARRGVQPAPRRAPRRCARGLRR